MITNYNVVAVFDKKCENILMCSRNREPYKGLYNLVGGKINDDEDSLDAAYRELKEETNISKKDIKLTHLMDFTYYISKIKLEVYVGRLNNKVMIHGDENDLEWIDIKQNFYNNKKFAGEGNIGHMMEQIMLFKEILL